MTDLWNIIAEIAIVLSPARVESAANKVADLSGFQSLGSKGGTFGPNLDGERWTRFVVAWSQQDSITPAEVAAALRASARLSAALDGGQAVDLVWTGPRSQFVPVRSTEQVMLELIARAHGSLFLVTFVNYGAKAVVEALNAAAERGVAIRMLLEGTMETTAKLASKVPSAEVFIWADDAKPPSPGKTPATVHAKCVVADRSEALVTSANLTDHALDLNMELGVHIMGGREPEQLHDHLNALVATLKIQPFQAGGP